MNINEFYSLTPIEFYYALKDWKENKENEQRFELEKMRIQTFYLINIQLPRNEKIRSPKELMPFQFDKITDDFEIPTPEKWKQLQDEISKLKPINSN